MQLRNLVDCLKSKLILAAELFFFLLKAEQFLCADVFFIVRQLFAFLFHSITPISIRIFSEDCAHRASIGIFNRKGKCDQFVDPRLCFT
ncbi:Uncharacterised protein [Mycobacteroides abscessus subsp. abscessus]|nr:Uncharacterised protein [Mycobacteroides abscessus subsp. abscessus]